MRKPAARSAVTFNALFMAYLTKYAPEGELEPCTLTWQFLQLFSMNREFAVGYPLGAPAGATRAPSSVERLSPDPKWPEPVRWQFQHRLGSFCTRSLLWFVPWGSWQDTQSSRTGACSKRNGPRFSAWHW
jgi:hypothetical protein